MSNSVKLFELIGIAIIS